MIDQNHNLMESIRHTWGGLVASACLNSSVPRAFLAALIANESHGMSSAKRFEGRVLLELWEVVLGRNLNFGSIKRPTLLGYLAKLPGPAGLTPTYLPNDVFQRLDGLASSWGLTQIMGYEVLDPSVDTGSLSIEQLSVPDNQLPATLRILAQFAGRYQLDLTKDFAELFDCWNSGRPRAPTADPNYVQNGLSRMKIYEQLEEGNA